MRLVFALLKLINSWNFVLFGGLFIYVKIQTLSFSFNAFGTYPFVPIYALLSIVRILYFFFLLEQKETKIQGQHEWLRPFVRPAPPGPLF
jgi:hypothetical protein